MLLDRTALDEGTPVTGHDVASLQLVCLVRVGDGYVVRAAGRFAAEGATRTHVDITFGAGLGRSAVHLMEAAVRHIQRWCDDGTTVALLDSGSALLLRADDGTSVCLPRSA